MAAEEAGKADDGGAAAPNSTFDLPVRTASIGGAPPPGQSLTGKQEHCEHPRASLRILS